jgi:alpha-galactosidase
MSDAIARVAARRDEKPMELSLSIWGWQQAWIWAPRIAQSWRINGDIKPWWSVLAGIIDQASFIWYGSNFYGHNDMDMLEVGNTGQGNPVGNLTYEEAKTHFTAWSLLKSPLIIGTDLRNATNQTLSILKNKDVIKINQDPNVGESISPFRWGINPDYTSNKTHPAEYWSGNSSYGVVFMTINSQDTPQEMFFNLTESWAIRAGRQYSVYDMVSLQFLIMSVVWVSSRLAEQIRSPASVIRVGHHLEATLRAKSMCSSTDYSYSGHIATSAWPFATSA